MQKEIAFFGQFLVELTEVVDGSVDEHQVYSLHASDFGIDVIASLSVAAGLATIVAGLTTALNNVIKFKKLKNEAAAIGVDEETLDHLTKQGQTVVETVVDELHAEVFQDCKVEEQRLHELETGVRFRLNGLANRLDQGYRIEIRTELPKNASDEQISEADKVSVLSSVTFQPVDGQRLLSLPESESQEESDA